MNTLKKNGNGITSRQMIIAIAEAEGYATKAAALLGVSRTSFYNYLKKYATAQQALADTREKRHEWVESKLMQQIKNDNLTAIIFYLKTQAKHLGYVERQEFRHEGKVDLTVVNWDDRSDNAD